MRNALLFFFTLILAAVSATAQNAEFTGDVRDVRVVRSVEQHPGASLLWEPYIAEWKPKQLVVAYGAGIPGKTDMGDIVASVSTNDGDTWSEPAIVFDHNQRFGAMQFGYSNAVLYKPPGQDVMWCFAMRCPMNYQHSEDSQLVGAFSADGGRSWTPVEMAMHYTGPLIIVGGIQRIVENGQPRYLLPAHRNTRRNDPLGSRDQFMLSSTSLLEWRLAGHIPQPESGPVFLHEGNLAPGDAEGELKLVMRTATWEEKAALDPPRAFSSVSQDGGRTWTPARQEPDLWNARSKGFFGQSTNGTHLYVYNDGPAMPKPGARTSLRYKLQPTSGGAWSAEKTFYDSGTHNSYPTLIEIAPSEFRAVWDSGTKEHPRTNIRFGKFHVSSEAK
ncbi:MAG: sialidase family protein [Chthoniobacter sp.]|uniref:sialidase family protein n=1 Tax=Chthoniobacter sp. TaxID=2510640 RepID=UPI0032A6A13A